MDPKFTYQVTVTTCLLFDRGLTQIIATSLRENNKCPRLLDEVYVLFNRVFSFLMQQGEVKLIKNVYLTR